MSVEKRFNVYSVIVFLIFLEVVFGHLVWDWIASRTGWDAPYEFVAIGLAIFDWILYRLLIRRADRPPPEKLRDKPKPTRRR